MSLTAEIDVIFLEQLFTTKLARKKLNKETSFLEKYQVRSLSFLFGQWKAKYVGNENDFKMRNLL